MTTKPPVTSPEILSWFAHAHAKEKQRESQQGLGRPIISAEIHDTRFVAVKNTILHSNRWKTFHDFLCQYIKNALDPDWGTTELAKPPENRHPILRWYELLCRHQKEFFKTQGRVTSAPMTGAVSAWLSLAYDLYTLAHNVELQQKLIKRIKKVDLFPGARYEAFVAAALIRAGFEIEFENEDDRTTTHCEFTATHKKSGKKYSIEAKQRNPGDNVDGASARVRLGGKLHDALRKFAAHQRIIFIDINVPDTAVHKEIPDYLRRALTNIRQFEGRDLKGRPGKPLPPAYVFVTNQPHGHNLEFLALPCAILAEGFQIPDFKHDAPFSSLRAAYRARKTHQDMHDLLSSMQRHSDVPATFDGEAPELAFGENPQRLIIGQTYLVPTPAGTEQTGTLTTACVNERESTVYAAYLLENGESVIVTHPITDGELSAYKRHPNTFFGSEINSNRKLETPLEIFDFFLRMYSPAPKEILLGHMANQPDIEAIRSLPQEDLAEILSERFTYGLIQNNKTV